MDSRRSSKLGAAQSEAAVLSIVLSICLFTTLPVQPASGQGDTPGADLFGEVSGLGNCVIRVVDIEPPRGVVHVTLLRESSEDTLSEPLRKEVLRVSGREQMLTLEGIPYGSYTLILFHDTTATAADTGGEAVVSGDEVPARASPPGTTGDALAWDTDFVLEDSMHEIRASLRDASPRLATLTVTMTGFHSNAGVAQVTLFDNADGFPDEPDLAFLHGSSPIVDGVSEIVFESVPLGVYAVGVIHDENSNERMDTNFFGKPREGYGASNDARGRFGPPSFEDARFDVDADMVTTPITIAY
jgi:uncharacterized protein (DUF2141 family)